MANHATVYFWGPPIHGCELKAMQLFNEVIQYYTGLKEKREIESFEAVLMNHFSAELDGFVIVRGERDKLIKLQFSEEGARFSSRSELLLSNFRIANAFVGDGVRVELEQWAKQVKELA